MLLKYRVELELDQDLERSAVDQLLYKICDDIVTAVAVEVGDPNLRTTNQDFLHAAVTRESVGAPWTAKATVVLR